MRLSSKTFRRISFSAFLSIFSSPVFAGDTPDFKLIQKIPLYNVQGTIHRLVVDAGGQRLFATAPENGTVEIVDLKSAKKIYALKDLGFPKDVLFSDEENRIFVTEGQGGAVDIFDASSYALIDRWINYQSPDGLGIDEAKKVLYIGYGEGAVAAVRYPDGKNLWDLRLRGHPQDFKLDKTGRNIFISIAGAAQVAVLDTEKQEVKALALKDLRLGRPLCLDEEHRRLFVGTERPPRLAVIDMDSGEQKEIFDISGGAHDIFYDPARRRVYVFCREGVTHVFEDKDGHFIPKGKIPMGNNPTVALFVPERGRFYAAVEGDYGPVIQVYQVE